MRQPASILFAYRAGGPFSGATFTRTGGGMHRNRLRLLATQANTDVPRIDWLDLDGDGDTETPSFLVEPAATNEFTDPEDLTSGNWTAVNLSARNADQAGDPEGGTTLDELVEDGTTDGHSVTQTATGLTADADYAFSVWAIANTRSWLALRLGESGAAGTNYARAWFNLSTGAVGTTSAGGTGSFTRAYVEDWTGVAAGLYRCVLVGSVGNGATSIVSDIFLASADNTLTYAGDGSSSLYAGYAQLEDDLNVATTYVNGTRNTETLLWQYPSPPQALTIYLRFQERGTVFGSPLTALLFGDGGDPKLDIAATGGNAYRARWTNDAGTTQDTGDLASGPSYGDTVELATVLNADGSLTLYQSINRGAVISASDATTLDFPAAWSAPQFFWAGTTAGRDLVIVTGALSGSAASIMNQARRTRTAFGSAED